MYNASIVDGELQLLLYGDIGEGLFGEGITAGVVKNDLQRLSEPDTIHVRINSPGGDVFEGIGIFNALKDDGRRVIATIDSLGASMASYIPLAAESIAIADNAMMMIHSPWTMMVGNAAEIEAQLEPLKKAETILVDQYVKSMGASDSEIRELLAAETWYTASEAVEAGLASSITGDVGIAAAIVAENRFNNAPDAIKTVAALDPPENARWRLAANQRRLRLTQGG